MKKWLDRLEGGLLFLLPIVVFFGFLPTLKLGMNETMNFELSLPLFWLILFGGLSLRKIPVYWKANSVWGRILWLAFPCYATISVLWSPNPLRGVLTVGIIWLLLFSILNILHFGLKRAEVWQLLRLHIYVGACVGVFCLLQCILDVAGVGREYTGLCAGCTSQSIGFPHPNGFAIEPQFMGNLLIAPALLSLIFLYYDIEIKENKRRLAIDGLLTFFIIMMLFLCFSRGAIYAFMLAVIFLLVYVCGKLRKFYTLWLVPLLGLVFGATLLTQGVFAQISPTNEGFSQGVSRSIEHLSLGLINYDEQIPADSDFDGYIEESTSVRLGLDEVAIRAWQEHPVFGVGLGGAGLAIQEVDANYGSREIVQNEYLQILLELGLLGVVIFTTYLFVVGQKIWRNAGLLALVLAYLASWGFFSGLPNALHIYLIPPLVYLLFRKRHMIK